MNKYLVYAFNAYNVPSIRVLDVEASDISQAVTCSGVPVNEVIAVKLRCPIALSED